MKKKKKKLKKLKKWVVFIRIKLQAQQKKYYN